MLCQTPSVKRSATRGASLRASSYQNREAASGLILKERDVGQKKPIVEYTRVLDQLFDASGYRAESWFLR